MVFFCNCNPSYFQIVKYIITLSQYFFLILSNAIPALLQEINNRWQVQGSYISFPNDEYISSKCDMRYLYETSSRILEHLHMTSTNVYQGCSRILGKHLRTSWSIFDKDVEHVLEKLVTIIEIFYKQVQVSFTKMF